MILDFLGEVAIIAAAGTMFLKFLDWILDKNAKEKINNWTTYVWNLLDDLKKTPIFGRFKTVKGKVGLSIALTICCLIISSFVILDVFFWTSGKVEQYTTVATTLLLVFFMNLILIKIAFWTSSANTALAFFIKFSAVLFVVILLGVGIFALPNKEIDWGEVISSPGFFDYKPPPTVREQLVSGVIMGFMSGVISSVICLWLLAALPPLIVLLSQIVLTCAEFIVRRIAEYEKGAVLGLSVVVGGLGAFLKFMAVGK